MSAAEIGASFDNYQGNAVAGGETSGALKIDTSPIMQMANYTVMYNKSVWEQRQVDAQNKINDLAKIATLNPNNALAKDKPEAIAAYTGVLDYARSIAGKQPKNEEEKIQQALDLKLKIGEATNKINSANTRAISYNAQKIDIENSKEYNAAQKKILLDKLDKTANASDIFTPISPTAPKFDLKVPKIGDPTYKSFDVVRNSADGNGKETVNFKLFDPKNMDASYLEGQGLASSLSRKATSDIEQTQFDLENASDNSQQVWSNASDFLNQAINDPKYKDDKGGIDFQSIEANNPLVANIVGLTSRWNDYAAKVKENIANGVYNDENGKSAVDPKEYFTIDPAKGISPAQLIYLEKFSKANPDAVDTKYIHTGDATAAGRLSIESKKADADIVYKRAMAAAAGTKAKAYVDNIKQQMKLRSTKQQQDQMLEDLYTRNITQQTTLVKGTGNGQVQLKIDAAASLPMFTFNGNKPTQLVPIDATPIGVDGQPIAAGTPNAKVAHWEGGHFLTQYIVKGKPLSYPAIAEGYNNYKKNNPEWQGGLDDFLKTGVEKNKFEVRIIGANGATDKQVSIAAQRAISNQATGKGETPVFSATDNPPTEDAVASDNSSLDNNLDQ